MITTSFNHIDLKEETMSFAVTRNHSVGKSLFVYFNNDLFTPHPCLFGRLFCEVW